MLGKLDDLAGTHSCAHPNHCISLTGLTGQGINSEAEKQRYQQLKVQIALAPNLPPYDKLELDQ